MTRHQSTPARSLKENVSGIVLASGMSRRFGSRNKLLMPVGGVPIVRRTVDAYLAGGLSPVLVVIGYEGDRIAAALDGLEMRTIENPEFREGQSRALARGVEALPGDVAAAVI